MKSQTNKRLSDVTKQQSVDRASKLASSFMSDDDFDPTPPPAPTVDVPLVAAVVAEPVVESPDPVVVTTPLASTPVADSDHDRSVSELVPAPEVVRPQKTTTVRKERARRSTTVVDLAEVINQPVPKGLRCTKMIMLADEHHDMLRELHFKYRLPLSTILYNLLEPAHEALQREHQKGN
jgi:hypothetical protein